MPMQARKANAKPKKEVTEAASAAPAASASSAPAVAAAPKKSAAAEKAAAPVAGADKAARPASAKPAAVKKEVAADSAASSSSPPAVAEKKERPPPVARTYYSGYAMVKAVLSGDSLTLAGSSAGGVDTPEKLISLTAVQAPKFGKGPKMTDEPFAWESREYLRKHVIGQQVQFTVQHTAESSDRHYGVVTFKQTDIAEQMIKAGWVRVKAAGKDGKVHPEKEALLALQEQAINSGLGMHRKGANPADHLRTIDWAPDAAALFAANKNTPMAAVVDQVRDGSTLRLELVHPANPLKHTMITLYLSGVSCNRTPLPLSVLIQQHERKVKEDPNYKGQMPKKQEKAEPLALEAQSFTETRLLNRDVQVLLQGVDKSGNLFGSIVFAKGNISQKLLEQGFGKLVPWSAALSADANVLKAAEAQAKAQKKGLWANWSPAQDAAASDSSSGVAQMSEFQGKVVSIPSADSVIVEDASGKEVRVWLASVRVPRLATRGSNGKDEPFAQEAKEFLRSKLIGHKIRVVPEYVRSAAADDDRAARQFASLFQNKININEALIASGFAEALQHRMDEERSQFYDLYLSAETKAKESSRGKWDAKEHIVTRVTDLTERVRPVRPRRAAAAAAASSVPKAKKLNEDGTEADAEDADEEEEKAPAVAPPTKQEIEALAKGKQLSAKAKQYLVFLQRDKQVNSVVEFVFSASRFKLLVPKENVLISFSLSGIRTPASKGADGKPDPLAEEILQYVRSKVQQHSVKIEVETMDKVDNFLGALFHNRTNLAVDLLQQGYASIFGFSAAKSPYAKDLYAAERSAKEGRKGMWKDWVEPTPEEKAAMGASYDDEESKDSSSGPSQRTVKITEIVDASDFFIQYVGDKNAELVATALAAVADAPEPSEPFNPPAGAAGRSFIAAGQFSDDSWHRVRCDGVDANGDWNVYFIDFGNYDTILVDRLRTLPAEAAKIPALAVHCSLAGLTPPKAVEYQEGSALAFSEMAFGVELNAVIEFTDKFSRKHVTLSHESHPISVNKQLLRDGWARVQGKPDRRISRLVNELAEEERYAKDHHFNLFEYGDVSDEEAEGAEKILGPDPKARAPRGGKPAQR